MDTFVVIATLNAVVFVIGYLACKHFVSVCKRDVWLQLLRTHGNDLYMTDPAKVPPDLFTQDDDVVFLYASKFAMISRGGGFSGIYGAGYREQFATELSQLINSRFHAGVGVRPIAKGLYTLYVLKGASVEYF